MNDRSNRSGSPINSVQGPVPDWLTDENVRFLDRIKGNAVLDRLAAPHLDRPVGRPPWEGYEKIIEMGGANQADSWKHPQRLVLVVVDRPDPKTGQVDLLPDYFFLIVGWKQEEMSAEAALTHYRGRGPFEDQLGEFNHAIGPHLSHAEFQENETMLRLPLLAFNLASALRIEYENEAGSCCDLARFQRDVLKAGARGGQACPPRDRVPGTGRASRLGNAWSHASDAGTCATVLLTPRSHRRAWTPPPEHAFACEVRRQRIGLPLPSITPAAGNLAAGKRGRWASSAESLRLVAAPHAIR